MITRLFDKMLKILGTKIRQIQQLRTGLARTGGTRQLIYPRSGSLIYSEIEVL